MKLRTRGNSIRLRLEQHEIKNLVTQGAITESIAFAPNQSFKYTLAASTNGEFVGKYQNGEIRIEIPLSLAKSWSESEEEGIYQTLNANTDFEIKLAVEKDFQCLHKRPEEDETGLFPNPRAND
ncbi:hypothetical protein [uncultured Imperialibacter sp.]|uniref:DUF7009 family protein n=1 Tax=uncultured Imperialibacter sp. TaxID=1672639 RepID=UPI0030D97F13